MYILLKFVQFVLSKLLISVIKVMYISVELSYVVFKWI